MHPNYGQVVSVDNKSLVVIDEDNKNNYKYTGNTVVQNDVRCATFVDDKGYVFMQPWAVAGMFRRKGEANTNATLKTEQVRDMVRAFVLDKAEIPDLAQKNNISEDHCRAVVTGQAWRHVTINLIHQLRNGNTAKPVVVQNKPKANRKLSPSIIPFIRKDKTERKMTTKELAKKYCVSESQIRRICAGKAWK